ncbi:MAG: tetratricopeptide repeat protein [Vicingaceae bacterium]
MKFQKIIVSIVSLQLCLAIYGQSKDVEKVLQLKSIGEIETSIKKGFKILHNGNQLSLKDSFKLYNILAYNLQEIGDNDYALEFARKAMNLHARKNSLESPNYLKLLSFYNATENYDSSIYYLKKHAYSRLKVSNKNDYGLAKTNNNIGFIYYLSGNLDSAEVYYKKVISIEVKNKEYKDIIGLATGNLGQLYFDKKDYKNALIHMKIDAELTKNRIIESHYNATLGIAECQLMLKQYIEAEKKLNYFLSLNVKDPRLLKEAYKLYAQILEKRKKDALSAIYLRKYIFLNDSLNLFEKPKKELINQLSRNRIDIIKSELELSENKNQLIENELLLTKIKDKNQQFKLTIYSILLVVSFLFVLVIIIYYKIRQRKNKAIQLLQSNLLESELNNKKKDLNNLATNLTYKRKFIDEVQLQLKELTSKSENEIKDSLSSLIREFTHYKNADKSVEVLQADIEKINLSFFSKLEKEFPLLTQNEKELCGLFLLNLSTKDIAIIRNVTPNAIKKARQRIRKKLPINETEKINTFLNNI